MIYSQARDLAEKFMQLLTPACTRIEIVGSVKRADKPEVHDIEILLIAKDERPRPEFGKPNQIYNNMLEKTIAQLEYDGLLRQAFDKKDGQKLKKRAIVNSGEINEFCIEFYIVNTATWGIQNVIRTGPSLFSHRFVTNQSMKFFEPSLKRVIAGFLPDDLKYIRGETVIKRGEETISLPEERDAIEVLGHGWIPPADRGKWAVK